MGQVNAYVYVGSRARSVPAIPRRLQKGGETHDLAQAAALSGGLILGEGDSGKSTYAQMLVEEARQYGPAVFVSLCDRRIDFDIPDPPTGAVTTLVLDGLDEFPDCSRTLVRRLEGLDPAKYHVWVTGRVCSASTYLGMFERFAGVYRLSSFTCRDAMELATSVGIDGKAFVEAVSTRNYDSFIVKPGGVVALLDLYATGDFGRLPTEDLMHRLAERLVSVSRDGVGKGEDEMPFGISQLFDAAEWMAACLVLAGKRAVWVGSPAERSPGDLSLDELTTVGLDRRQLLAVLDSRMFEPLGPARLRIAYADMPDYLAGHWAARHLTPMELRRLAFWDEDGSCFLASPLLWASSSAPDAFRDYVAQHPILFFRCPSVVACFGFSEYLDAVGRWCGGRRLILPQILNAWTSGLTGSYREFAEWLTDVLQEISDDAVRFLSASALLVGCTRDYASAAQAILRGMVNPRLALGDADRATVRDLLTCLCEQCRRHALRFADSECVRLSDVLEEGGQDANSVVYAVDVAAISSRDYCPAPAAFALGVEVPSEEYMEWRRSLDGEGDPPWTVAELVEMCKAANRDDAEEEKSAAPGLPPDELLTLIEEAVAEAMRNKGGRPRKSDATCILERMTQAKVADMINCACKRQVCNAEIVANWEAYVRTGGRRGSCPPAAEYEGHLIHYTADMREHPNLENLTRLKAIIGMLKTNVKHKIPSKDMVHCKSDETLFRAQGGIQAELARQRNGD